MPGTLSVVATPIGNLEDITFRALRVLREADVIAAEDTRRTAKLLARYAVTTPMLSFHEHNTRARLGPLLRRLERGDHVALVTDAGTPGISDPGIALVHACVKAGIAVEPIPGPSAPLAAAVVSGFPLEPLTIFGFTPARSLDRRKWLEERLLVKHTFTFFEAPHRIQKSLSDMASLSGERQIMVAREVTKVHQQFLWGTASDLIGHITELQGEFTVVIGPSTPEKAANNRVNDSDIGAEFWYMTDTEGLTRRQIVVRLARKHGRSPRDVYEIIERLKISGI